MEIINNLIPVAQAHTGAGEGYNMMSNYGFMGMGGGFIGGMFMLLFWILVIIGAIYFFKYLAQDQNKEQHKDPMEILKERYAKGEIDEDEFEQRKKDLL
jgi:putative membrane protein